MSAHMAHMQHSWNSRQQPPITTTMPAPKDPPPFPHPSPPPKTTMPQHTPHTHQLLQQPMVAKALPTRRCSPTHTVSTRMHEHGAAPSKTARYTTCRRVGDQHTSCPAQAATQTTLAMNNSVMCILPIDMQGYACIRQPAARKHNQTDDIKTVVYAVWCRHNTLSKVMRYKSHCTAQLSTLPGQQHSCCSNST